MIKKEIIDVRSINNSINCRLFKKPSLDAFPIRDISVPFNSNSGNNLNYNHESIKDTIDKIKEMNKYNILNKNMKGKIKKTPEIQNLDKEVNNFLKDIKNEIGIDNKIKEIDEDNKIKEIDEDIKNEIGIDNKIKEIDEDNKIKEINEDIEIESNNLIRAVLDMKKNTLLNKGIILIFIILMIVLLLFGVHKMI